MFRCQPSTLPACARAIRRVGIAHPQASAGLGRHRHQGRNESNDFWNALKSAIRRERSMRTLGLGRIYAAVQESSKFSRLRAWLPAFDWNDRRSDHSCGERLLISERFNRIHARRPAGGKKTNESRNPAHQYHNREECDRVVRDDAEQESFHDLSCGEAQGQSDRDAKQSDVPAFAKQHSEDAAWREPECHPDADFAGSRSYRER
jgi:hypothetical protein